MLQEKQNELDVLNYEVGTIKMLTLNKTDLVGTFREEKGDILKLDTQKLITKSDELSDDFYKHNIKQKILEQHDLLGQYET